MKSIRIAYFLMALTVLPIQANWFNNLSGWLSPKADQPTQQFSW